MCILHRLGWVRKETAIPPCHQGQAGCSDCKMDGGQYSGTCIVSPGSKSLATTSSRTSEKPSPCWSVDVLVAGKIYVIMSLPYCLMNSLLYLSLPVNLSAQLRNQSQSIYRHIYIYICIYIGIYIGIYTYILRCVYIQSSKFLTEKKCWEEIIYKLTFNLMNNLF